MLQFFSLGKRGNVMSYGHSTVKTFRLCPVSLAQAIFAADCDQRMGLGRSPVSTWDHRVSGVSLGVGRVLGQQLQGRWRGHVKLSCELGLCRWD